MKATKLLREQFGLSQVEMAQYLSVTRSQLAMYEKGDRELPTAALQKLAEMELFLGRKAPKKIAARPHEKLQKVQAVAFLQNHAKALEYQQAQARQKLATAQKKYAQKMLLLDLVDHLKAAGGSTAAKKRQNAWLSAVAVGAMQSVNQNGLHVQLMLQMQISGLLLQYEQAMAKVAAPLR